MREGFGRADFSAQVHPGSWHDLRPAAVATARRHSRRLVQRQQQAVIEYLRTENQVLKEKLGKKRLLLDNDQRRRLAVKGKVLGRKLLHSVATIVTSDTILRWHRQLVAEKWTFTERRSRPPGRPSTSAEIVELVLRFARENPPWGFDRIQGALANLGHKISDTTVGNILKENGIEPAPDRKRQTTWKAFLKSHWDVLASIDFTTVEAWTRGGLVHPLRNPFQPAFAVDSVF